MQQAAFYMRLRDRQTNDEAMKSSDGKNVFERQAATVGKIKPMLAGLPSEIQGATLAELLALWIAGHAPELRSRVLDLHVLMVEKLVPVAEWELFGKAGHPAKKS